MNTTVMGNQTNIVGESERYRENEAELGLPSIAEKPEYLKLYQKDISEEKLAQKVLKKRGKADTDQDELKKARSYAKHIIIAMKPEDETTEEVKNFDEMSLAEKDQNRSTLTAEQQSAVLVDVMNGKDEGVEFKNPALLMAKKMGEDYKKAGENVEAQANLLDAKQQHMEELMKQLGDTQEQSKAKQALLDAQKTLLQEAEKKQKEIEDKHVQDLDAKEREYKADLGKKDQDLKNTEAELAKQKNRNTKFKSSLSFIPYSNKDGKEDKLSSSVVQGNRVPEGRSITVLNRTGWRARRKLKRILNHMKEIGDNPKKGVSYLFAMTKWRFGRDTRTAIRETWNLRKMKKGKSRNVAEFRTKAMENMKHFIEDVGLNVSIPADKEIVQRMEHNMTYYIQAYAAEQAGGWNSLSAVSTKK